MIMKVTIRIDEEQLTRLKAIRPACDWSSWSEEHRIEVMASVCFTRGLSVVEDDEASREVNATGDVWH